MDDDLTFGASVWGAPDDAVSPPLTLQPPPPLSVSPGPSTAADDFDDFDNFRTPAETVTGSGDEGGDDDFGDFGDFGETQTLPITPGFSTSFGEVTYTEPEGFTTSSASVDWLPLRVSPLPTREQLQEQVDDILDPLWMQDDTSYLTDDAVREVGGLNQTLVTPERYLPLALSRYAVSQFTDGSSRQLYNALLPPTPPSFQPVNWTRSRIRRQHLIHLGIPINLDEVLPRTNGALPTLEITTRPMSAPPGPRGGLSKLQMAGNAMRSGSRPASPSTRAGPSAAAQLRLGPRPDLDERRAEELLHLSHGIFSVWLGYTSCLMNLIDRLSLMPFSTLEAHLADIKAQTAKSSALLTHLLQTRDALQQDSEMYNKLIGELVGEAQKIKTGKRAVTRRGSGMV